MIPEYPYEDEEESRIITWEELTNKYPFLTVDDLARLVSAWEGVLSFKETPIIVEFVDKILIMSTDDYNKERTVH